jgi:hypothetical protein
MFVHFHGDRIVFSLGGYDKGVDVSERKQRGEIKVAQKALRDWKRQETQRRKPN